MAALCPSVNVLHRAILSARSAGSSVVVDIGCGPTAISVRSVAAESPTALFVGIDPWLGTLPLRDIPPNLLLYAGCGVPTLQGLAGQDAIDEIRIVAPMYAPVLAAHYAAREDNVTLLNADFSVLHAVTRLLSVTTERSTTAQQVFKALHRYFPHVRSRLFLNDIGLHAAEEHGVFSVRLGGLHGGPWTFRKPETLAVTGICGGLVGLFGSPRAKHVTMLFPRALAPTSNHFAVDDPIFQVIGARD